ncbi:MAG: hypothetical protein GY765_19560 [bacterium]|nr:hypothetical protein [bacterium]
MDKSKFNIKEEWRKFGIALAVILGIVAAIIYFKGNSLYPHFGAAAGIILVAALVVPIVLKPVFIGFSYLGHVMGWIMTRLILGILYYLVMTPIRLVSLIFGKQFLDLKINKKKKSYWIINDVEAEELEAAGFEKQF